MVQLFYRGATGEVLTLRLGVEQSDTIDSVGCKIVDLESHCENPPICAGVGEQV